MVFSSHLFLFYFLPLALAGYYLSLLAGRVLRGATGWGTSWLTHGTLTLLSYLFYGWANPLFVVLMFSSTVIDYICGLFISRQWNWTKPIAALAPDGSRTTGQRVALAISICSNLSLLGFFKYFNFGLDSYNSVVTALGADDLAWHTLLRITLPLGISFYTFQSMSYSIDVYRGDARAIRHFIDFSCYVAMFPQLVAGPIIRFQEVDDQLRHRRHTVEKFSRGVALFAMGLTKKVMLANPCGKVADVCFDAGSVVAVDAWVGAVAYAMQIYYDFSGYTDMAIGLGLMMGFMFPKNFDSPYLSQSITEFWRRWHISLSTWLRDYLYIPLGGNRKGKYRTYANLAIVMLLGGLWHGASWNFVIWGAWNGGFLLLERTPFGRLLERAPPVIGWAYTILSWMGGLVIFKAGDPKLNGDMARAGGYLLRMVGLGESTGDVPILSVCNWEMGLGLVFGSVACFPLIPWLHDRYLGLREHSGPGRRHLLDHVWHDARLIGLILVFYASVLLIASGAYNPFLYFQF